jgi:hypothetical protein
MSFCSRPVVAAKNAVNAPTHVMTISVVGAYSSKGDDRNSKYTPAVTRVAAWIRAETGVGPSIASGNQVCNPSCADLPIAAKSSNNPITVSAVSLMKGERLNTVL